MLFTPSRPSRLKTCFSFFVAAAYLLATMQYVYAASAEDCGKVIKKALDNNMMGQINQDTCNANDQDGSHTNGSANRNALTKDFNSPETPKNQIAANKESDLTSEMKSQLFGFFQGSLGGLGSMFTSLFSGGGGGGGGGGGNGCSNSGGKYGEKSNKGENIIPKPDSGAGCPATGATGDDYRPTS